MQAADGYVVVADAERELGVIASVWASMTARSSSPRRTRLIASSRSATRTLMSSFGRAARTRASAGAGQRPVSANGIAKRLAGTRETERDAEDGCQDDVQVSETR